MIVFIAFSAVYICFLLWVRFQWVQISDCEGDAAGQLSFSVILPVRNEAQNIVALINDLMGQEYPKELFEIIVVDDWSEDGTLQLANTCLKSSAINYQVISLKEQGGSGKKQAISCAVAHAKNEIILATDGDCRVGSEWISSYANCYSTDETVMVTGPVKMQHEDLFTRLQTLEFAGLIGIGAASLHSGNPGMCNGANLSYRKAVFEAVKGYEGNSHVASGDDEFLLQKVYRAYPGQVRFLKDQRAVVSTPAKSTFGAFINQRIRWSSKWKFHSSFFIKLMALVVFFQYASVILGAILAILHPDQGIWFGLIFGLRWLVLSFFIAPIAKFFEIRQAPAHALLIEIIYPIIVLFLGIASIFGHYSWKGRRYS